MSKNPKAVTVRKSNADIGQLLAERRVAAGVRQADLARALGRTQSYVSKVESGDQHIDVVEFIQYVTAIGVDPIKILRVILRGN
jgi:transcriptional regulator with XRE-family HTH domain